MSTYVKSLTTAQYQALLTGLPKYCPNTVFTIGGQSYTTPQVVALITSILNVSVAVAPAKAAWLAAVQAVRQAEAKDGETVKEVRAVVALMFNNAPTTLAELAISPRKPPKPLSAEARAAATAKSRATRKARGTTGKKQKAAISGNVTGVVITPVTSTSSAPAAPASSVAAAGQPVVSTAAAAGASGSTAHA